MFDDPLNPNLFTFSTVPQTPGISPSIDAMYNGSPTPMQDALLNQSPQANAAGAPPVPQLPVTAQDMYDAKSLGGLPTSPDSTTWHPHKATTLGKIADVTLAMLGIPMMPFTRTARQQNMNDIYATFTQDPLGAIQKMLKTPGMQKEGLQMYEQYEQLHKNDAEDNQRVQYYHDLNEDHARGVLSSYLGAIAQNKDPATAYSKMLPTLRNFATQRGLGTDLLPDAYDPGLAQTVMISGIKPENQMQLAETHNYHQQQVGLHADEIIQTGKYRQARLGQIDQHENAYEGHNAEQTRHNQVMEGIGQQNANTRSQSASRKGPTSYAMTKYGPGEISPDGKLLKVSRPDGNDYVYSNVGGNNWKIVKVLPRKPMQGGMVDEGYNPDDDEPDEE